MNKVSEWSNVGEGSSFITSSNFPFATEIQSLEHPNGSGGFYGYYSEISSDGSYLAISNL